VVIAFLHAKWSGNGGKLSRERTLGSTQCNIGPAAWENGGGVG